VETFKIDVDAEGVALVTFDVPGRSMNTLTAQVTREYREVVDRIRTDPAIKGAVITSGKTNGFCAGRRPRASSRRAPSAPATRATRRCRRSTTPSTA
jgi:3-hydroxyacyl-CoA dehydrogenase/enoyl-CoA hydratase/3-hydroxybutyryl-CoA epimerase